MFRRIIRLAALASGAAIGGYQYANVEPTWKKSISPHSHVIYRSEAKLTPADKTSNVYGDVFFVQNINENKMDITGTLENVPDSEFIRLQIVGMKDIKQKENVVHLDARIQVHKGKLEHEANYVDDIDGRTVLVREGDGNRLLAKGEIHLVD
jgi:hypothetical protein